jgi:hypothetical protein
MRRIKVEHERTYSDVVDKMLTQVVDHTTLSKPVVPRSLSKLANVLGWDNDPEALRDARRDLLILARRLAALPKPSRQFLCILVARSKEAAFDGRSVSIAEVKLATNLSSRKLREHFSILDGKFTYDAGENEFGVLMVGISRAGSEWPIWTDLKAFCKRANVDLANFIVNLDFSALR